MHIVNFKLEYAQLIRQTLDLPLLLDAFMVSYRLAMLCMLLIAYLVTLEVRDRRINADRGSLGRHISSLSS